VQLTVAAEAFMINSGYLLLSEHTVHRQQGQEPIKTRTGPLNIKGLSTI
jgi:hypothetical protein